MPKQNLRRENGDNQIEPLLTSKDVSEILRVTERHVANLSKDGEFPEPIRLGRSVRYRPADIHQWLDRKSEGRTSMDRKDLAG